jgi:hypothetical protein
MAVRVQWEADGPFAICDTPAEAMELLRQARATTNGNAPKAQVQAQKARGAEDKVRTLVSITNEKAKKIFRALLDNPGGIEGEALSKASGLDLTGIGGVLGSISKAAVKSGFTASQIIQAETRMDGTRRFRWFEPGKVLLEQRNRFL